ncbi:MAG: hypothetical protein P0Y64_10270 [Candidatus Sphingomonas colombiensis]|nr:hypothetical protein [Sphingomonas sp.]WEK41793.1 MAG: hypothetical protein P0Y64_10270 [Sphingomonas sp.]
MGKWFGGIVTALVILAMTSALGAWLKAPIDDWVSRDRLQAEVQLAPWYARPAVPAQSKQASASDDALNNALAKLRVDADSSDYGIARVTVTNDSSNPVTNINFRLMPPLSAQDALIIDAAGKTSSLHDVNRIMLPDMKPGDKALVYLWGNYSSYLFPERFRTYSSAGRFRVNYDWPTAQDRAYESGIGRFLDDYAVSFVWVSSGALTLLFGLMAAVYNGYYKLLLKDEGHYNAERTRYLADPEKFEPKSTVSVALELSAQQPVSAP